MSLMDAMEVAASGLAATRLRMNLTASNLANANTTRTAEGGPYRRRDLVLQAVPIATSFAELLRNRLSSQMRGVQVQEVVVDPRPPRTVYDPGHPDADRNGIVRLPNVNMVEEMVDMITASRSYEAGLSTLQTLSQMAERALAIGK
jgi:flagellar basal-body rod protein FlgC